MNARGVRRMLRRHGQRVTFQRIAGTDRAIVVKVDNIPASVTVGAAANLSDTVQQTADSIMLTDLELRAGGFTDEPKHGDQCIYEDGRVMTVQGRAQVSILGPDRVFTIHALGA